jgi:hypothetical protein
MKPEVINEVLDKLIGPTSPVGETHTDSKRFESQQTLQVVINHMLDKMDEIKHHEYSHEHSRAKAGKDAADFLSGVGECYQ